LGVAKQLLIGRLPVLRLKSIWGSGGEQRCVAAVE